jgi:outer membrane protein
MTLKMIVTASAALMLAATAAQAAPKKAATAAASPTPAATAPAASAAPPLPQGPAIPGVCVYHNDAAISASLAGKAAAARMQQLKAQVSAELQAENAGIKTDAEAFQAKRASLTQEQLQQQAAPIQQRVEALDRKAQLRQRELEVTGQKALQRIGATVEPILRSLYQQHGCSLMLNGDSVMASNREMDLTGQVVQQLNAQLSTITFDREILPAQQ